jgi:hypothetical protein
MTQSTAVSPTRVRPGSMGIVAPRPELYTSTKYNQRIEVRPGEPVYIWIERRVGAGVRIEGFNKNTPFNIEHMSRPPQGVALPRAPGDFYRVSVDRAVKPGIADRVFKVTYPVVPNAQPSSRSPFTLVTGAMRYY